MCGISLLWLKRHTRKSGGEEGFTPRPSLAFLPPETSAHPLLLAQAIPLLPEALARLAPAVERAGIHLGVWGEPRELVVSDLVC